MFLKFAQLENKRAMALKTSGQQWYWPQRSNWTSDLNSVTSITLISMCILPVTANVMPSEVILASKWPRRSDLTSELNSVTSITYGPMSLWPLSATISRMSYGGKKPAIDERGAQRCPLVKKGKKGKKSSVASDKRTGIKI